MDATFAAHRFRNVVFLAPSSPFRPRNHSIAAGPTHSPSSQSSSVDRGQESFLRSLFFQAKLNIRSYRLETLRRRIPACLRVLRCTTLSDARRIVRGDPHALQRAMNTMLIGVTGFFRDVQVFDALRHRHLPALVAAAAPRPLRVWSVACSDGSELYSVAMLLHERSALAGADLLGTDCRGDAIESARGGLYSPDSVLAVPPELIESSFQFDGRSWRIADHLRSATRWDVSDALQTIAPGPWDIILCRNVSMYLHPEHAAPLWQRLERALYPGGLLILGKAERPDGASSLRPLSACIYQRDPHPGMLRSYNQLT